MNAEQIRALQRNSEIARKAVPAASSAIRIKTIMILVTIVCTLAGTVALAKMAGL